MTTQAIHIVDDLPGNAVDAATGFMRQELPRIVSVLTTEECQSLVVVMRSAAYDHADWRRAMARDLARKYAPKRVNLVSAEGLDKAEPIIQFLAVSPGVTGQYLEAAK